MRATRLANCTEDDNAAIYRSVVCRRAGLVITPSALISATCHHHWQHECRSVATVASAFHYCTTPRLRSETWLELEVVASEWFTCTCRVPCERHLYLTAPLLVNTVGFTRGQKSAEKFLFLGRPQTAFSNSSIAMAARPAPIHGTKS